MKRELECKNLLLIQQFPHSALCVDQISKITKQQHNRQFRKNAPSIKFC